MIGRPGLTALMLTVGILPAQVDEIKREAEREHEIARLASVTAWSSKAHGVLVEAACLGISAEDLIAEAGHRGPDAALELVARTRAAMTKPVEASSPPPVMFEPSYHPFRVGDRLARRLGGRR